MISDHKPIRNQFDGVVNRLYYTNLKEVIIIIIIINASNIKKKCIRLKYLPNLISNQT